VWISGTGERYSRYILCLDNGKEIEYRDELLIETDAVNNKNHHISPNGSIGVFDSGVGGLTVLREIARALPDEDCVYLGDTARLPYGNKSRDTVTKFALKNSGFLVSLGIKFLVIACNTAASAGLDAVKDSFDVPTTGVIKPEALRAAKATKNRRVGVIGTRSTITSGAYERAIHYHDAGIAVVTKPCPLFVPLAEEGWFEEDITHMVAERYLADLIGEQIDTLVLGCTHYPLLKKVIAETMGRDVALIDSAVPIAREVKDTLESIGMLRKENTRRQLTYYVTDDPKNFARVGESFLGFPLEDVRHVDIAV
jgi:glutamate racemase